MSVTTYILIAIVVLAIIFLKKTLVIIPQSETMIIERLGKYYATLKPGINIIINRSLRSTEADIYTLTLSTCASKCMTSTDRTLSRKITSRCR